MTALEGSLVQFFTNQPARRVFSARQDFASTFTRLIRSPLGTAVKLEITDRSLPLVFAARTLAVSRARLLLRVAPGTSTEDVQLALDGQPAAGFAPEPTLGDLPSVDVTAALSNGLRGVHSLAIVQAGGLARTTPTAGDIAAIDDARLLDVLLYVEYKLA